MPKPRSTLGVKLFALVLLPCLGLLALAGAGARGALAERSAAAELDDALEGAGLATAVVHALQIERTFSSVAVADPALVTDQLVEARAATDAAATALAEAPTEPWRIAALQLNDLASTRTDVDGGGADRDAVLNAYTDAIIVLIVRIGELAAVAPDDTTARRAVAIDAAVRLTDVVALQRAIVGGAAAADEWVPFVDQRLSELDGAIAELLAVFTSTAVPADVRALDGLLSSAVGADRFLAREQAASGAAGPLEAVGVTDELVAQLRALDVATVATATGASSDVAAASTRGLVLHGALAVGALAYAVAAWLSIDRLAVRRLFGLATDVDEISRDHLPDAIARAVADPTSEVVLEPIAPRHSTELDALVRSVNELQLAAVGSSIDAVSSRAGSDSTLVALGHRQRELAERQLRLLGELDVGRSGVGRDQPHGTVARLRSSARRLGREADGLLVAGGGEVPARPSGRSVPVSEVVDRAVATIELAAPLDVRAIEPAFLRGDVAPAAVQVIAEVLDVLTGSGHLSGATVSGRGEGRGYVVAVLSHGTPFDPADLAAANHALTDPSAHGDAEWFGLAVAGRLARRHQLDIELIAGEHGPLAKVVLGPHLVSGTDDPPAQGTVGSPTAAAATSALPTPAAPEPAPPEPARPQARTEVDAGFGRRRHAGRSLPPTPPRGDRPRVPDRPAHPAAPVTASATPSGPPAPGRTSPPTPRPTATQPAAAVGGRGAADGAHAAGGLTASGLQRRVPRRSSTPQRRRTEGHASRPDDPARAAADVQTMLDSFRAGVDHAERRADPAPRDGRRDDEGMR